MKVMQQKLKRMKKKLKKKIDKKKEHTIRKSNIENVIKEK